jgi:catechol 2,3-dioxygenase-like lactoylglutathione lyase family enzyme
VIKRISVIAVVVEDQEEALRWYVEKLGFEKRTDQRISEDFRWVSVTPSALAK